MFARALGLSLAVAAAAAVSAVPALAQPAPASTTAATDATHAAKVATKQVSKTAIRTMPTVRKAAIAPPSDGGACTTNRQAAFALAQPPMAQSASQPPQTVVAAPVTPVDGNYLAAVQQTTSQRQLVENCARGNATGATGN